MDVEIPDNLGMRHTAALIALQAMLRQPADQGSLVAAQNLVDASEQRLLAEGRREDDGWRPIVRMERDTLSVDWRAPGYASIVHVTVDAQ